jgi:hypothetical protein
MGARARQTGGAIGAIHFIAAVAAFKFKPDAIAEPPAKAEQTNPAMVKTKLTAIGLAQRRHALAEAAIQAEFRIIQVVHANGAGHIRAFNELGARRLHRAKPQGQGGGWQQAKNGSGRLHKIHPSGAFLTKEDQRMI